MMQVLDTVFQSYYFAGGKDADTEESLTDVLIYDHTENEWTSAGDLSTARRNHAISMVGEDHEDQCIFEI